MKEGIEIMKFIEKLKSHAREIKNSLLLGMGTVLAFGSALAEGEATNAAPTTAELTTNIITPITSAFSTSYILQIIAAVLAAGVVYMVLWWAVRYVFRRIKSFAKGGKGRV